MERKKCIKPNCGFVYTDEREEFAEGYCICGCVLEPCIREELKDSSVSKTENVKSSNKVLRCIDVYFQREVQKTYALEYDEVIIGRKTIHNEVDLDLSPFDEENKISRNHILIYRNYGRYYLRNISTKNSVHVNREPLAYGEDIEIVDDTEIILSGFIGLYFYEDIMESEDNE